MDCVNLDYKANTLVSGLRHDLLQHKTEATLCILYFYGMCNLKLPVFSLKSIFCVLVAIISYL